MRKPRIGITHSNRTESGASYVSDWYLHAVEASGGEPIPLDYAGDEADAWRAAESLDGVLFSGGGDIAPAYFGREPEEACGTPWAARDRTELWLFRFAAARRLPVLGICRGVQLINVAMGGTLIQDIPSCLSVNHRLPEDAAAREGHAVDVATGSRLRRIVARDRLCTNSLHHQSVEAVAPGLRVAARATELGNVIEALEATDDARFLLGVQWHPERMFAEDPVSRRIFEAFVAEAENA